MAQLLTYKRRVGGKLRTPSSTGGSSVNPLWAPYLDARVDTAHCFRAYPECAIFNRTELRLGENAAATKGGAASLLAAPDEIDRFMVRKCCIEHDQMLRALRSLNAALRSSSSTSSGGSNSRGVKKGGPAAGAAGTVADRDGGGGDDDAGLPLVWLTAGTLLGAVREGGRFIPWDTDVDIAVWPEDAPEVEKLFSTQTDHHFHQDPLGKKMFWVHFSSNGKPRDGPHAEIFFEPAYTNKPKSLLPLERCDFYGYSAWCPNRNMFGVWFGNWHVYGGCHYHDDKRATLYEGGKRIEKARCE